MIRTEWAVKADNWTVFIWHADQSQCFNKFC